MAKETVQISWYPSKANLARFVQEVSRRVRVGDFPKEALSPGALVYDLGHFHRNFEDFPRTIPITVLSSIKEQLSSTAEKHVVVEMSASDFLTQLQLTISAYFSSRDNPLYIKGYRSAVDSLGVISKYITGTTASITFGLHYDQSRFIESVRVLPVEK